MKRCTKCGTSRRKLDKLTGECLSGHFASCARRSATWAKRKAALSQNKPRRPVEPAPSSAQ